MTILDDENGVRLATGSGDENVKVRLLIPTAKTVHAQSRLISSGTARDQFPAWSTNFTVAMVLS